MDKICSDILLGNCDECPAFISKHCQEYCKTEETGKAEPKAPNNTPKGWIKLKATENDIYINTSTIVGLSVRSGASGAFTEIYTIGAEENPWLVDESIDAVIEKIKKA